MRVPISIRLLALCMLCSATVLGTSGNSAIFAQSGSGVVRVARSGSDTPGCGSAAQPCASIQFAVDQAATAIGTFSGEVRVAAGTYTGDGANVVLINRLGTLAVRGGYTTTNWDTSNPTSNITTIDGQNARRGVNIQVGLGQGPQCNITVSGFTITRGLASQQDPFGGGLLNDACTTLIENVTITDSQAIGANAGNNTPANPGAGGGLAIRGNQTNGADRCDFVSSVTLKNITLRGNRAQGGNGSSTGPSGIAVGGGMFTICATITGNQITANGNVAQAGDGSNSANPSALQKADALGGGICTILSTVTLSDIQANENTAEGGDAKEGGDGLGGGINIELSRGSLTDVIANKNIARGGTGSSTRGGSGLGGAFFITDSNLTSDSVTAIENIAIGSNGATSQGDGGGGGIYLTKARASENVFKVSNLILAKNTIASGTGPSPQPFLPITFGGGIQCGNTRLTVDHATIVANSVTGTNNSRRAPAISLINECTGTINNSIIADHGNEYSPIYVNPLADAVVFNTTLVSGNKTPFLENEFNRPVTEQGTFSGDPQFVAPNSNNYHILGGSAARNAAVGSTTPADIDDQKRPDGTAADVGADEFSTLILANATETPSGVIITWTRYSDPALASYELRYTKEAGAGDAQEGASPITSIAASANRYVFTGLTDNKSYQFTLVALNAQGNEIGASRTFVITAGGSFLYMPIVLR